MELTEKELDVLMTKSVVADLTIAGFLSYCETNKIDTKAIMNYTRGFISSISREKFKELKELYLKRTQEEASK